MLRRTFYMNKRKEKKAEIDKTQQIIKQIIEKKYAELKKKLGTGEQMPPNQTIQLDSVETLDNFQKDVREYILIANKYLNYKNCEE